MSEDKTSNTSSIDQAATVVATTNDDVSASLTSALFSAGNLNSAGSLTSDSSVTSDTSVGSAASAVGSAYSAAALSSLDQTYYNGSLDQTAKPVAYAASLTSAPSIPDSQMPSYTSITDKTLTLTNHSLANADNFASNGATASQTNLYKYLGSQTATGNMWIGATLRNGSSNGLGHAIYSTVGSVSISTGALLGVGRGNTIIFGTGSYTSVVSQNNGNVNIVYNGTSSASLQLQSGAYLSANGYLGGVANKAAAGGNLSGQQASRTGNIVFENDTSADVNGDWGVIGDISAASAAVTDTFGDNVNLHIGGTLGVFMKASALFGSNNNLSVSYRNGSGVFVGSGALMSTGVANSMYVHGGMGAAYSNQTTNEIGRLMIADNNSITLDQANYGNFAAQAGAVVSTGSNFYLRALELSVGYGQAPTTGAPLSTALSSVPASMTIGNNATITLAQSGLIDNGTDYYLGSDGAIVVDAKSAQLSIGNSATIIASEISVGNFAKDYSGYNATIGSTMNYGWFTVGSNNNIVIGSAGNIVLSGGIDLDGINNSLTLMGDSTGATTGVLTAGSISAGNFYKQYVMTPTGSSHYVYQATSGTKMSIGDHYNIVLSSGVYVPDLPNASAITMSNDGNIEINQVAGSFTFGSSVNITANSMVVGDYSLTKSNAYVAGQTDSFSAVTSAAVMSYGANDTVLLSGSVLLNGAKNSMLFNSNLSLTASTLSMGSGVATTAALSNVFSAGTSANITLSNGYTNTVSNGIFRLDDGGKLDILSGDLIMSGASTGVAANSNLFQMGNNAVLTLATGDISVIRSGQTMSFGDLTSVIAGDLTLSGTNQSFVMGAAANLSITSGIEMVGTSQSFAVGLGAQVTLDSAGVDLLGTTQSFIVGADAVVSMTDTFNMSGSAERLIVSNGGSVNIANSGFNLLGANQIVSVGNNATLAMDGAYLISGTTISTIIGTNTSVSIGGDMSFATSTVYTQGSGGSFDVANNIYITPTAPTITFGAGINYSVGGAWNISGLRDIISLGNGATGTLGDIVFGPSARSGGFNTGLAGSTDLVGNVSTLSFGNATLTSNNSFTMGGIVSGQNITLGGANTLWISGGSGDIQLQNIFTTGTSALISAVAGNDVNISGSLQLSAAATTFTYGGNGNLYIGGNVLLANTATAAKFTVGNNTSFMANSMTINGLGDAVTFGTSTNFEVTNWNLAANNTSVTLGAGATGGLGNVNFGVNVSNNKFDIGSANSLTIGNINLSNANSMNFGGSANAGTVSLAAAGVLNVSAGATLKLQTLSLDNTGGAVTVNVSAGATLSIASLQTSASSTDMPVINITGGTVFVEGQAIRAQSSLGYQKVNFNSTANGIYQYDGAIGDASGRLAITGFLLSDKLVFRAQTGYTDQDRFVTSYANGILTIGYVNFYTGATDTLAQFTYTPAITGQIPNVLIQNTATPGVYDMVITKCFLTGTHLLTPQGEVTVENLKAGDHVMTLEDGQQVSKEIIWAGNMDVNVNHYEHKGPIYPVRIKAHAFGLNQPCRDLLVTPEHTIFVDGGLIPARMLVNGRSIIVDTTIEQFTVYHIETKDHSILLSENLTTESYLNTDNRHLFNGDVANLHLTFDENANHQSWENDAAAPLTVARHQVEPIWNRLDRRATQQGYTLVSKPETTRDPALCLITQKGERLQPVDVKGNTYSFYVPANVCIVAMHSKAALPSEVVGPFLDDRRMLGVLVAKISVFGDKTFDVLPADMTGLSGWHSAELNRTDRWTKGLATLPEAISEVSNKVKLIKVELTATSDYFADTIEFAEKIA